MNPWIEVKPTPVSDDPSLEGRRRRRAAILLAQQPEVLLLIDEAFGRSGDQARYRLLERSVLRGASSGFIDLPAVLARLMTTNFRVSGIW
jgi:hypothetical protein